MEVYKFETTVLENGVIQLPEIAEFAHRPVEIFVVLKQTNISKKDKKQQSVTHFLEKWTGFLQERNPDDAKLHYLQEKYK